MHNTIISLKDITFSYDKKKIFQDFSLDLFENSITYIMGVNGCGKTTLLKIVCGFLEARNGVIELYEKDIKSYSQRAFSQKIAYVPQTISLNSNFLVKDYLAFGRMPYKGFAVPLNQEDFAKVEKYAIEYGVDDLLEMNFNELSNGQKQMIAITRAMVQETPIIIMDEPMSALDLGKQAELLILFDKLRIEGKTLILTTHNPNHAKLIDCNVCLLDSGNIVEYGNANKVLSQDNIRKIYGEYVKIDEKSENIVFNLK